VNAAIPLSEQSNAFLDVITDCEVEAQGVVKALQSYSDAKPVAEQSVTQATAYRNSLASLRKLIESAAKSVQDAPECSIKPPSQQCSI